MIQPRLVFKYVAVMLIPLLHLMEAHGATSEQATVELTIAAMPSVVPRHMDGYAAGIDGLGILNPETGEWVSIGLVPMLARSRSTIWNPEKDFILYRNGNGNPGVQVETGIGPDGSELKEKSPVVEQAEGLVEVARSKIPSGGPYLLLLGPGGRNGTYRIWIIPDDRKSLPPGSMKIINTTESDLACEAAGERFLLPPGGNQLVRTSLQEAAGMVPIRLAAFDRNRNAWRESWSSAMLMRADERRIMLIPPGNNNKPHGQPLSIKGF